MPSAEPAASEHLRNDFNGMTADDLLAMMDAMKS
jgi:hypothetical protein